MLRKSALDLPVRLHREEHRLRPEDRLVIRTQYPWIDLRTMHVAPALIPIRPARGSPASRYRRYR